MVLFEEMETVNPYESMVEKVDMSSYFYRTHQEDIIRLYHLLVHGMTCLNHVYRLRTKQGIYESSKEDNVLALQLLQGEGFSDYLLSGAYRSTYRVLMSYYGTEHRFTALQANMVLGMCKSTLQRHMKVLCEQGYLVKCGGNQRTGYQYQLIDRVSLVGLRDELRESEPEASERSIFEAMLPAVGAHWPLQ